MSICTATGLDVTQVFRALQALEAEGLVEVRWVSPSTRARVVRISGEARRAVGQWPTSETALERTVQALEVIAGNTDHPAHEDAATAADAFRHACRALQAVGAAALTGEMP